MPQETTVNPLLYVDMKMRRAKYHFDEFNTRLDEFLGGKDSHTVIGYEDLEHSWYVYRIEGKPAPEVIAMVLGDWLCCLRSALDQLAWQLMVIGPKRGKLSEREEKMLYFPVIHIPKKWPPVTLPMFAEEAHPIIDRLQPYKRGTAYKGHPLWQLNELCRLDKHRMIPVNSAALDIHFPLPLNQWERFLHHFYYGAELRLPLAFKYSDLKPTVTPNIVFGEHMGEFELSREDLRTIDKFVREEAIPPFAGLFSKFEKVLK